MIKSTISAVTTLRILNNDGNYIVSNVCGGAEGINFNLGGFSCSLTRIEGKETEWKFTRGRYSLVFAQGDLIGEGRMRLGTAVDATFI